MLEQSGPGIAFLRVLTLDSGDVSCRSKAFSYCFGCGYEKKTQRLCQIECYVGPWPLQRMLLATTYGVSVPAK